MKSLVFIVLLVVAGIAGYYLVNKPAEVAVVEEAVIVATDEVAAMPQEAVIEETAAVEEENSVNMTTPADMPEAAQAEMYASMMEYNKCMMQDKVEYHQGNFRAEDVAGQTLAACEPKLDGLKAVLVANNVNTDLREGMIKTVRQRSTRKLMSAVMQSQAAGMTPMNPASVPTP